MTASRCVRAAWLLAMILSAGRLYSQDYLFQVPRVEMTVIVLTDGSAAIGYDMDFINEAGAHPIDIVDVGFPNEDVSNTFAMLDGVPATNMGTSQYVKPGYEVHLPSAIPPGGSGRFQFFMRAGNLVYQDVTRKDDASFQITPTWFGSQYVRGLTEQTIRIYLPPGVTPEEALSQNVEFSSKETRPLPASEAWQGVLAGSPGEGLRDYATVVTFNAQRAFTGPYLVGVSFPKRVMSHVIPMTRFGLFSKWYKSLHTFVLVLFLAVSLVLFLFGFHRFTGGTGMVCLTQVGFFGGIALFFVGWSLLGPLLRPAALYLSPVIFVAGLLMFLLSRFARPRYVPALVSVEGGGIKRGLTAPEAAALLELPAQKVAAMILFGMVKKDVLRQTSSDPPVFAEGQVAVALLPYEKEAQRIVKASPSTAASELDFGPAVANVVTSLVAKMKGYNVEETREYYRQIVSRAWEEVKVAGMDEIQWRKKVEDKVDWMMLDPAFPTRIVPIQNRYQSSSSSTLARSVSTPSPSSVPVGPGLSQVAAGFAGWMQNTAGSIVATVAPQQKGLIDLSSLDKAARSKGGGSGRSSGGGGSCACACAGCACACACAGGGR